MKTHLALASCLLAASLASAATNTAAAAAWPDRPVKVIVGFAPGGPTDLVARLIAQQLTAQTGKNFFVENVPGAGGNVGAVKAAQSAPDGYTILVTGGNITNNPFLFAHAGFDHAEGFRRGHARRRDAGGARRQSIGAGQDRQGAGGVDQAPIPARRATPRRAPARRRSSPARCSCMR